MLSAAAAASNGIWKQFRSRRRSTKRSEFITGCVASAGEGSCLQSNMVGCFENRRLQAASPRDDVKKEKEESVHVQREGKRRHRTPGGRLINQHGSGSVGALRFTLVRTGEYIKGMKMKAFPQCLSSAAAEGGGVEWNQQPKE